MASIDEVLERLITDPRFRQALTADPRKALAGYDLSEEDIEMLSAQLDEDAGGQHAVEQRTSKSALAFLAGLASDAGGAADVLDLPDNITTSRSETFLSDSYPMEESPTDVAGGGDVGGPASTATLTSASAVFPSHSMEESPTDLAGGRDVGAPASPGATLTGDTTVFPSSESEPDEVAEPDAAATDSEATPPAEPESLIDSAGGDPAAAQVFGPGFDALTTHVYTSEGDTPDLAGGEGQEAGLRSDGELVQAVSDKVGEGDAPTDPAGGGGLAGEGGDGAAGIIAGAAATQAAEAGADPTSQPEGEVEIAQQSEAGGDAAATDESPTDEGRHERG